MPEFLDRILGRVPAKKSGSMAKERLQFILVHDRINLPPERMEAMKREILEVIAKYVSVDNENVEIALQKRERSSLLVAEIPFLKTLEGVEFEGSNDKPTVSAIAPDDDDDEVAEAPATEAKAEPVDEIEVPATSTSETPAVEEAPKPAKPQPATAPKRKR
jgi:cell division topological specificity factor